MWPSAPVYRTIGLLVWDYRAHGQLLVPSTQESRTSDPSTHLGHQRRRRYQSRLGAINLEG